MVNYHLLQHDEIDKDLWDYSLEKSLNPLIYATSWYLDTVSPNWQAIVSEDYQTIFPVTVKRKLGINIILQPPFAQQLGIFSPKWVSPEDATAIFKLIPYPILALNHHSGMVYPGVKKFQPRPNYILPLDRTHAKLEANYQPNCKRNLKKAAREGLTFNTTVDVQNFTRFIKEHGRFAISEGNLQKLDNVAQASISKEVGFIATVLNRQGDLLSMAFFLNKFNRVTFFHGVSTPEGFLKKSMFFLIDEVIKIYSDSRVTLDFEGSANAGIARFYKGFGAFNECYHVYLHPALEVIEKIKKAVRQG